MNQISTSSNGNPSIGSPAGGSTASWSRLLWVVLVLVGVGFGGFYWWVFAGGEAWWSSILMPSKAAFHGKVTLDGEPLHGGQLLTYPDRAGIPRSVGFIDQDGEFVLRTDINGKYLDEAFVGRHRVSIEQFQASVGPTAPRLMSPAKYANPATSGLSVSVDRDPSKNYAVFALVSDSQEPNPQRKAADPAQANGESRRPSRKSDSGDSQR